MIVITPAVSRKSRRVSGRKVGKGIAAAAGLCALPVAVYAQQQNPVSTGRSITPPALSSIADVGSLPMNVIRSQDGRFAITTDMGFRESLNVVRTQDGAQVSSVPYMNSAPNPTTYGLYYGLAISSAGVLYAAQGANDTIAVLQLAGNGILTPVKTIPTKKGDFPSGLALDGRGYLYVANNDPDLPLTPCSVAVYDTSTGKEVGRVAFRNSFGGTPNFPLGVAALASGKKIYVSSQRDAAVYVIDTSDPTSPKIVKSLPTGLHPTTLMVDQDQDAVWVVNSESDTVSLIDPRRDAIVETIPLDPKPLQGLAGGTPTGLALTRDESHLYVSMANLNAVTVVDTRKGRVDGYIPAGWYPTGVVLSRDEGQLLVVNGKGSQTRYPNPGYKQWAFNSDPQYDLNLIEGNVLATAIPARHELDQDTRQVLQNIGLGGNDPDDDGDHDANGDGLKKLHGKIQHVVYIVKENRTYDQVLGDLPEGEGDPGLVMFGQKVTPNQHALAQRFTLLDNFFDCGEASGDGWPWSTQSMANEYVSKNLPYNYSNRGRNYDFEGQDNGYLTGGFTLQYNGTPVPEPAIPDVAEAPGGHLWDVANKNGISYRNYGFYYSFGAASGGIVIPDNLPASSGIQPGGHDLAGRSDLDYRRYDADYPDSDAPAYYAQKTGNPNCLYKETAYGQYDMPSRFSEWKREFQEMLAKDPTGRAVPALMTVRFMHDHTVGTTPGKHSPRSEVADNDYAVGQLVDAISHSPIWESTAIFIIEDDAQDGPDHVDCHRSTCYVISPWIQANTVDHHFYNTDSVLKTMEDILGLPPMTQFDALANPIGGWDRRPSNTIPYNAVLPDSSIICEMNPSLAALKPASEPYRLAKLSASLDFVHPDSAPSGPLNEILWKATKGYDSRPPQPQHHVFPVRPTVAANVPSAPRGRAVPMKGGADAGPVDADD